MNRRKFLKSAALSATGITLGGTYLKALAEEAARGAGSALPRRKFLGDIELSVIGFGGIIVNGMEQEAANREVAYAVERGVNYFDVAPSYGNGESETKLGPALQPFRDRSFLACKTTNRDAKGAAEELEASLRRLKTDYFDLYQLHAMTKLEHVDQVLAPGGALEAFAKAKEAGKIRHIGFSAHSQEAALKLLEAYEFDSILYPVNYVCYAAGDFGPAAIELAKKKGVARLALKALAYTPLEKEEKKAWPKTWYRAIDDLEHARRALRFTLSEDVTTAIPPSHSELFRIALDIASTFEPLSASERQQLLAEATDLKPLFRA